jgi:hypothetical protein
MQQFFVTLSDPRLPKPRWYTFSDLETATNFAKLWASEGKSVGITDVLGHFYEIDDPR